MPFSISPFRKESNSFSYIFLNLYGSRRENIRKYYFVIFVNTILSISTRVKHFARNLIGTLIGFSWRIIGIISWIVSGNGSSLRAVLKVRTLVVILTVHCLQKKSVNKDLTQTYFRCAAAVQMWDSLPSLRRFAQKKSRALWKHCFISLKEKSASSVKNTARAFKVNRVAREYHCASFFFLETALFF